MVQVNLYNRLDVFLKKRFVETYINNDPEHSVWVDTYLQAIKYRNGFKEPNDATLTSHNSTKNGKPQFLNAFYNTINSIKNNGFDTNKKIPTNSNGNILNGSHRLAIALALKIDLSLVVNTHAQDIEPAHWSHTWFINFGFRQDIIDELTLELFRYHRRSSNILLDFRNDPRIDDLIPHSTQYASFSLNIKHCDAYRLIKLIYDIHGADLSPIQVENKCKNIGNTITIRILQKQNNNIYSLKETIRALYNHHDRYTVCHTIEKNDEADYLTNILFRRIQSEIRNYQIINHLNYREICEQLSHIEATDFVIVGGSVMQILGIKLANDIDIIIPSQERRSSSAYSVAPKVDVVSENYLLGRVQKYKHITDDNLIKSKQLTEEVGQIKFLKPSIVIERKLHDKRPKDLVDINQYYKFKRTSKKVPFTIIAKSRIRALLLRIIQSLPIYKHLVRSEALKTLFIKIFH